MPIDITIPKDNDLISTFPAAIREARQIVAEYAAGDTLVEGITVEHPVGSSTFVTAEELASLSGVTASVQTQIDGKEPAKGVDDNYVTDAEKIKLSNLSGTNTGDQDLSGYEPAGTAAGLITTHSESGDHDERYYTEIEVNNLLHDAVTISDTTSINLSLTGQALSADAIFGTTSGTVAQGNDSRFVTNGDTHDHSGGDGAQIAYSNLSGLPTFGTISSQAANNVSITGGTVNGTTIGDTTPAAGAFSVLRSQGLYLQSNRIDADTAVPNGYNAVMFGDFELGPDATITCLGNATFTAIG